MWVSLKITQGGLRGFRSMFPLTRVPFWLRVVAAIWAAPFLSARNGWVFLLVCLPKQQERVPSTKDTRVVWALLFVAQQFLETHTHTHAF